MPTQVGLFAKHWTPGRVKTRLAAAIGDEASAKVARLFLETIVQRLAGIADRTVIGFAPEATRGEFVQLAGPAWQIEPQSEGDLGQRMRHYFATAFENAADRVVLLGADSPSVPLEFVEQALTALETQRMVLGPTDDGGYYLIGARGEPPPVLEGMPWSTAGLWHATLERLDELGWRAGHDWRPLPAWFDVDTMKDLKRLRSELASQADDPALRRLAARLGELLPA